MSIPFPELLSHRLDAVVMGASAGGVEALLASLPSVRPGFPVPIVVVVHLPAREDSLLASIFSDRCQVPVREVKDKEPLEPGTVYFSPPDYHVLVEKGGESLSLSIEDAVNYCRPSIDVLFESAAWAYGPRVLGIILSGANRDGAAGLAAIARAGGLCWVQDPEQAIAVPMPLAAIEQVPEARVLRIEDVSRAFQSWPRSAAPGVP
jgi:two-component system chemotaxis response regulator CheB